MKTKLLAFVASGALSLTATSVTALTIDSEFDSSITAAADAASVESAINTAITTIDSLYSNAGAVGIVFTQAPGSGFVAQSTTSQAFVQYSQYVSLLSSNSINNPANTTLSTAITNLPSGNKPGPGDPIGAVAVTTVDERVALGMAGVTGFYNSSGTFVSAGGQAYDGVVTLNTNLALNYTTTPVAGEFSAISAVEHEINEVLGGGGQGSVLNEIAVGQTKYDNDVGVLDLYRYSAPGVPSFTTSGSATSYFSVDGGVTDIVGFNQVGSGDADYGDFASVTCFVQLAFACDGQVPAYTTSSPEFAMMESIGYDPNPVTATPLPSTWTMLIAGFVGLGFFANRGNKNIAVAFATA